MDLIIDKGSDVLGILKTDFFFLLGLCKREIMPVLSTLIVFEVLTFFQVPIVSGQGKTCYHVKLIEKYAAWSNAKKSLSYF